MKVFLFWGSVFLFLYGCTNKAEYSKELMQANSLSDISPDSAYYILKNITRPEEMTDANFAYWCLVSGRIFNRRTDSGKIFLPALYYKRACSYYMQYGSPEEKLHIRLYWGQAYQETADYNEAMQIYTEALTDAIQWQEYNAAGMICCNIGNIYSIQEYVCKSKEKYNEAIDYFKLTGNQRAIALALKNLGLEYLLEEKNAEGLIYLLQADSIADLLQEVSLMHNISQSLGIAYIELEEFLSAEKQLLKALRFAETKADSVVAYYGLSDAYIAAGDYDKAFGFLKKGTDEWTTDEVYYKLFQIEKGNQNFEQALVYLEACQQSIDSIQMVQNKMHTIEIEQKHNLEHTENQKNKAQINAQRNFIILLIMLVMLLFTVISYQLMSKRKNKIIADQQKELDKVDNVIFRISTQLQREKENLKRVRQIIEQTNKEYDINFSEQQGRINLLNDELFATKLERLIHIESIGKRVVKMAQKVVPGVKGLSDKEWEALIDLFRNMFPLLKNLLWNPSCQLSESEVRLSLLTFFNLEAKQEAILLNIAPVSIYKQRTRLRQKLQLGEGASLFDFFKTYCLENESTGGSSI